jgi:alkyl hydroperoxide reductase subunit AhpF
MADLTNDEQIMIRKEFEGLSGPVTIKMTIPTGKNDYVPELRSLLERIAEHDERITLETVEEAPSGDDEEPPILPVTTFVDGSGSGHGIFFYGVPGMNALESLVKAIVMVSSGEHGLPPEIMERAKALGPTKLEVLYTPSTPGCSQSIDIANRLAYAIDDFISHSVELIEFPVVAEKYNVLGLPKTVANGSLKFTGLYSLEDVLQIIEKKIGDVEE